MPCPVTFLNNLEGVLNDNGSIYFIVPDKRYCFDHFKRETDIFDVLQLYYEKNYRPRLSDTLKMACQTTHSYPADHWNNNHGEIYPEINLIQNYERILSEYNTGKYIDSHVSFFTPESFMKIIRTLNLLKLINLKIHKIYHTIKNNFEFYVILKKNKET